MAIQNFLNGGYIGKLGQTVGQRWKDKKIIRTYVVPKNPNTPAQKQMREQFATANKLAQQAMTINGHQGIWDTSKVPEYSQRVGQAMRRLRLGYSEQDSLPLFPEGQSPASVLAIQNVTYDAGNQSWTFAAAGFDINNPVAAELTFYTPLNYSQGKYQEGVIHATVDKVAQTITVDLSAANTTDGADVKSLFQSAMELGFCAIKAAFYDALGSALPNISISRKYAVAGKLYDFDESLTMLDSTDKVVFTQAFTGGQIAGTITPFQTTGFPIVYRVLSENQYYGGIANDSLESAFITQNANQDTAFTIAAPQATGNLKETNATTFALTVGATQPQITKDVSTETYAAPVVPAVLQDITFAGNSVSLIFDSNLIDSGVASAEATFTWYGMPSTDITVPNTLVLTATPNASGETFTFTNADLAMLNGGWVGSLAVDFKEAGGQTIQGLSPDLTGGFSDTVYITNRQDTAGDSPSLVTMAGKAINNQAKVVFNALTQYATVTKFSFFAKFTYKDGTSDYSRVPGFSNLSKTAQNTVVYPTATTGKEITQTQVYVVGTNTVGNVHIRDLSEDTFTVPAQINITVPATWTPAADLPITLPSSNYAFIASVDTITLMWEQGENIWETDAAIRSTFNGRNATLKLDTYAESGWWNSDYPVLIKTKFLYEDNTECTTTQFVIKSDNSVLANAVDNTVADYTGVYGVPSYDYSSTNVLKLNVSGVQLQTGNPAIFRDVEIFDADGDVMCEVASVNATVNSATQLQLDVIDRMGDTGVGIDVDQLPPIYQRVNGTIFLFGVRV